MKNVATRSNFEIISLGSVSYVDAIALQEARAEHVRRGTRPQALYLLQHDPPLVSIGRNADRGHVLHSEAQLAELGIELHHCSRGGDVTYHGPGQLVAYSVLDLSQSRDLGGYLRDLEEVILRTLRGYGVVAHRVPGLTGVWVGEPAAKIAAIGVHASRWVTTHGVALNVSPNLAHFASIVPCGLRGRGVTSLAQLVDSPPTVEEVAHRYAEQFRIVFAEHLSRGASQPARGADHHSHAVGSHAVGSHADGSHADDPHANRSHHETSAE